MPLGFYGEKAQNELQKETEKKIFNEKMATLSRMKTILSLYVCITGVPKYIKY